MERRLIAVLATGAMLVGACAQATGSAARSDPQIDQLEALAVKPAAAIDDSLFILWEYGGALRERALARAVLTKAADPEVRALAGLVRDGHQAGMDAMTGPASELGLTLPTQPTALETAAIAAAQALPVRQFEDFFIRRQRSMHAWDVTAFDDFRRTATNPALRAYVDAVRAPLREHSGQVDRLARRRGLM